MRWAPAASRPRRREGLLAFVIAAGAACTVAAFALAAAPRTVGGVPGRLAAPDRGLVERGRSLFVDGCSSCHGLDARGIPGRAPTLRGVGAASADFYLSTGRMPLDQPRDEPARTEPAYSRAEIGALVAYVGSLGGPPVPDVDPRRGSVDEGLRAFTANCAGCHQVGARGGIVTGAIAPPLQDATPTQIAEAVRVGPYLMPAFSDRQLDRRTLDSIARYVVSTRRPDDRGGWGIGHIGPIPEGMVAWLLAGVTLLFAARVIGERGR